MNNEKEKESNIICKKKFAEHFQISLYRFYYPQTLRDLVSPVCVFLKTLNTFGMGYCFNYEIVSLFLQKACKSRLWPLFQPALSYCSRPLGGLFPLSCSITGRAYLLLLQACKKFHSLLYFSLPLCIYRAENVQTSASDHPSNTGECQTQHHRPAKTYFQLFLATPNDSGQLNSLQSGSELHCPLSVGVAQNSWKTVFAGHWCCVCPILQHITELIQGQRTLLINRHTRLQHLEFFLKTGLN